MTKEFTTDNRWGTGALEERVPDNALAAYGARWIDYGDSADVVPDRQGFARDDEAPMHLLIQWLMKEAPQRSELLYSLVRDEVTELMATETCTLLARRAGGYIYVQAWIVPERPTVVEQVVAAGGYTNAWPMKGDK